MMSNKNKRFEKELMQLISDIISKLDNNDLSLASVIKIELNKDYSNAHVYVNFFKNGNNLIKELQKKEGFIKKQIAISSNVRKIPSLKFYLYNDLDEYNKIDSILNNLKNE